MWNWGSDILTGSTSFSVTSPTIIVTWWADFLTVIKGTGWAITMWGFLSVTRTNVTDSGRSTS